MDAYVGVRWGPGDVDHGVTTLELMAAMAGVHLAYLGTVLCPVGLTLDHGGDGLRDLRGLRHRDGCARIEIGDDPLHQVELHAILRNGLIERR
jgi:hypothetical protein